MVGSMALFNIKLDVVNAVILPMIMGVGIDNGVHIIHRYLENKTYTIEETVSHIGRAISMCSLTTVIGFGSLVSSTYNALALMGLSIALGMVFCLFHSLITLPLLLTFYHKKQ
jgi:predicted RND superfamily exporter protein